MDETLRTTLLAHDIPITKWEEIFAEQQPEIFAAYVDWTTKARTLTELDPKVREFILVAIDSIEAWPYTYVHINNAFNHGATIRELAEVIITAGRLMGPHTFASGLTDLDRVIKERREAGLETPADAAAKRR